MNTTLKNKRSYVKRAGFPDHSEELELTEEWEGPIEDERYCDTEGDDTEGSKDLGEELDGGEDGEERDASEDPDGTGESGEEYDGREDNEERDGKKEGKGNKEGKVKSNRKWSGDEEEDDNRKGDDKDIDRDHGESVTDFSSFGLNTKDL